MQDRYLSKAKRKDNGEWVQGVPFEIEGKTVILINDTENLLRTHYLEENMWTSEIYAIEVDPSTICRCTGLKDKHGNLIFENDIVKHYNDRECPERYTFGVIVWDEHTLAYYRSSEYDLVAHLRDSLVYEVVGNTVDEPDLLDKIRQE